jgi:sporulation protein YlmC with PRC-barrel domain
MYGKEFLDKDVVGSDGWKIGKSKEIICDPVTWQITQIEIEPNEKFENEIGVGLPFRHNRLPLDITYVQGVGDLITLKVPKKEITTVLSAASKARQLEAPEKGPIVV